MSMTIQEMIALASMSFPDNVIEAVKRAKFRMEDIYGLTRDDVDQEFKAFRFGIRKSLWVFFKSLQTGHRRLDNDEEPIAAVQQSHLQNTGQQSVTESDSQHQVGLSLQLTETSEPEHIEQVIEISTEPEVSRELENLTNETRDFGFPETTAPCNGATKSRRKPKLGMDDTINTFPRKRQVEDQESSRIQVPHPDGIFAPFPFNEELKESLKNTINLASNKTCYSFVVREAFQIMELLLNRVPSLEETDSVANNLCIEYPCLLCDESHATLYLKLRKRRTGLLQNRLKAEKEAKDKGKPVSQSVFRSVEKPAAYPDGLPHPFPLTEPLKKIVKSGRHFSKTENRWTFLNVVKEVCTTMDRVCQEKPTNEAYRAVARSLCTQYQELVEDNPGREPCEGLYVAMRKFRNGLKATKKKHSEILANLTAPRNATAGTRSVET